MMYTGFAYCSTCGHIIKVEDVESHKVPTSTISDPVVIIEEELI